MRSRSKQGNARRRQKIKEDGKVIGYASVPTPYGSLRGNRERAVAAEAWRREKIRLAVLAEDARLLAMPSVIPSGV